MVPTSFVKDGPKLGVLAMNTRPLPKRATYRKTKVIQSDLRIWGTYDPIESGSSDPKKWGLYGCSVKKCRFLGQKWAPAAAPRLAVQWGQHKNVVFLVFSHDGNKEIGGYAQILISGRKQHFWAQKGPLWAIGATFRFRVTPVFVRGTRPTRQKVFPHPTVGAPSASNSPSALSAQALRAGRGMDTFQCEMSM